MVNTSLTYKTTQCMRIINKNMLLGIEKAKDRALAENQDLQIMIVKLPSLQIHSSNVNAESLSPYLRTLPVKLQESMWTRRKSICLQKVDIDCQKI